MLTKQQKWLTVISPSGKIENNKGGECVGQAIFITGTGTDIGKTVVTSVLAFAVEQMGKKAIIYKPIQTGLAEDGRSFAERYWYETKMGQKAASLYCMEPAVSPHFASRLTNTTIEPAAIQAELVKLTAQYDVVFVEGAGGLAVPLIEREDGFYMTKDFIHDCQLPIVIVSLAGLGAIHHAITTVLYAKHHALPIIGLVVNQLDSQNDIHVDNVRTLQRLLDTPLLATLPVVDLSRQSLQAVAKAWLEEGEQTEWLRGLVE